MSDPAIRLSRVSKLYKLYGTRRDTFLDAVGMDRVLRWLGVEPRQFWALRDIDLEVPHGSRIGIVGRNGAGKSTLLKIVTGAIAPTEGTVKVTGRVQALFDAGSGFHPDFTGHENVHASLTYQGLDEADIRAATAEIAEFTELGQFLNQPLKTYSLGMQARLAFAVATATRPDILIVDEVLGAGDAYFASKSSERMRMLVEESGATVLLVSHDTGAVLRYCEQCVWVERGRIVQRGPAMEVVNAYEAFIHDMEDRRLRAKNRRRGRGEAVAEHDEERETLTVVFRVSGNPLAEADIAEVSFAADDETDDRLRVGDVQDADPLHSSHVAIPGDRWSEPRQRGGRDCRALLVPHEATAGHGHVNFVHPGPIYPTRASLAVCYRTVARTQLSVMILRNGVAASGWTDLAPAEEWAEWTSPMSALPGVGESVPAPDGPEGRDGEVTRTGLLDRGRGVRWAGEGSLTIDGAALLDQEGKDRAVFTMGSPMSMRVGMRAHRDGVFPLRLGVSVYRLDGIFIANLISPTLPLTLRAGEQGLVQLDIPALALGDARYVVSISAFDTEVEGHTRYDLLSRAFEFQVVGNPPLTMHAVTQLPARWDVVGGGARARPAGVGAT